MKTYANTLKESTQISFDYDADYQVHLDTLKSEISLLDHRNPDLKFDDMTELYRMLEFGDDEE